MDRDNPPRRPAGDPESPTQATPTGNGAPYTDRGAFRQPPRADDPPTQAMPALDRRAAEAQTRVQRPVERPVERPGDITPTGGARGARKPVQVKRLRRGRLAIRKISPWATFKFSLVFYFCMLLVALLGTAIIFAALKAFGVVDNVEKLLRDLEFDVTISGGIIFRWMFLLGLIGTVIASAITVFLSFLYNLIADVVGGIEILVTERE